MRLAVSRRELQKAQPVAMRVEAHRLGVDGDDRSEIDAFREVTQIKLMGHAAQRSAAARPRDGAQEKTRTSTSFRPLEPESSASTNSATWASRDSRHNSDLLPCQPEPANRLCLRAVRSANRNGLVYVRLGHGGDKEDFGMLDLSLSIRNLCCRVHGSAKLEGLTSALRATT